MLLSKFESEETSTEEESIKMRYKGSDDGSKQRWWTSRGL